MSEAVVRPPGPKAHHFLRSPLCLRKDSFPSSFVSGHDFEACPERSRRVPISRLFLTRRADFSPRGLRNSDFFRSQFSCSIGFLSLDLPERGSVREGRLSPAVSRLRRLRRLDFDQFLAHLSQNLAPFLRDNHHIFNANATSTGYINSGLYGHHHARRKPLRLTFAQSGRLVNLQSNAMSGGVGKVPIQLGPAEHRPHRFVHFTRRNPWPNRGNSH